MGNGMFCSEVCDKKKQFTKRKSKDQITFLQTETKPQGILTSQTIKYLTPDELTTFKVSSSNNNALLKTLLGQSNPKIFDSNRTSLLHVACRSGTIEIIEQLVKRGYQINIGDINGETPLHIAAAFKREKVVAKLVEMGGNPFIRNRQGKMVYELLSNQSYKRMMTEQIKEDLSQFKTNSPVKSKYSNKQYSHETDVLDLMRQKYQQKSEQQQVQRNIAVENTQDTTDILERRLEMIKLSVQSDSSLMLQKKYYEVNKDLFKILFESSPGLAKIYLHCSKQDTVRFVLQNKILQNFRYQSLQFLTNLTIHNSFQMTTKLIRKVVRKGMKMLNVIQTLKQYILFYNNPIKIHTLCWIVTIVLYQNQTDVLPQMDAFHNLLYLLIVSSCDSASTLNQPFSNCSELQQLIALHSSVLKLDMLQVLQLTQKVQSKKKASICKQKNLSQITTSAVIMGKQGTLKEVAREGMIFLYDNEAVVFVQLLRGQYDAIKVSLKGVTEIPQRFKFNHLN